MLGLNLCHHPRRRSLELFDIPIAADRNDALAFYCQGLRDGEAAVHGDDLAVDEQQIGCLGKYAMGAKRSTCDDDRTNDY
jgi:hypothetical protein